MNKRFKILYYINKYGFVSQRSLAEGTGLSLGLVNSVLKELVQEEYLRKLEKGRKATYQITAGGQAFLKKALEQSQDEKLSLSSSKKPVHTAVILAAGANNEFDCPVGLLKIEGIPLIEHILRCLTQYGIDQICVVIGSQKEQYKAYFHNRNIVLVENERYKWNGTMASLACASDFIKEDFLLIDGNQIFEENAIRTILETEYSSCVTLTNPSGSGDEAYVELNGDGSLFRISKDIKQMNHVDAELVGISRISYPMYQKMLETYSENSNPFVSYEYVIEDIARIYQIFGCHTDDLAWCVVENKELLHRAESIIYPKIKKKTLLAKRNHARETLKECLQITDDEIDEIRISGGMTNTNYYAKVQGNEYILRIPGACTEWMVNRKSEQHNSALASIAGINPNTIYFNPDSGVKITEYIADAETLSGKTVRLEKNIKKTTSLLKTLHTSDMKMYNDFSVKEEYGKYRKMLKELSITCYEGFEEMDEFFDRLMERLDELGLDRVPCHNDLVAENFIMDSKGRLYLIDWEYSGYNDPMWDLAAHLLECEFTKDEEELFLFYYFGDAPTRVQQEKILIFKICQDILWSAWTPLKEAQGEDFGTYGADRLNRAIEMKKQYETIFKIGEKNERGKKQN